MGAIGDEGEEWWERVEYGVGEAVGVGEHDQWYDVSVADIQFWFQSLLLHPIPLNLPFLACIPLRAPFPPAFLPPNSHPPLHNFDPRPYVHISYLHAEAQHNIHTHTIKPAAINWMICRCREGVQHRITTEIKAADEHNKGSINVQVLGEFTEYR